MKFRLLFLFLAAAAPLAALWVRAHRKHTFPAPPKMTSRSPIPSTSPVAVAASVPGFVELPTKKVQLRAVKVERAKAIPDRLLSEQEGEDLQWPSTSFVLFYKKGFKIGGINGAEELVIHKAWYQPLPSSSWSEVPKELIEKCDFRLVSSGGQEKGDGNVAGFSFDDAPPGTWRLDAEVIVKFTSNPFEEHPDAPTPGLEGHARFTTELSTPQSGILGNPVELHSAWIDHLEWAPTLKGPWKRVPEPGQSGFPLHVRQPLDVYLRAVKRFPRDPWPTEGFDSMNSGQRLPKWEGRYWNTRIERDFLSNPSDDIMHLQKSAVSWFNFERVAKGEGVVASSSNSTLLSVIANAGSNKTAQLWVEPLSAPRKTK